MMVTANHWKDCQRRKSGHLLWLMRPNEIFCCGRFVPRVKLPSRSEIWNDISPCCCCHTTLVCSLLLVVLECRNTILSLSKCFLCSSVSSPIHSFCVGLSGIFLFLAGKCFWSAGVWDVCRWKGRIFVGLPVDPDTRQASLHTLSKRSLKRSDKKSGRKNHEQMMLIQWSTQLQTPCLKRTLNPSKRLQNPFHLHTP